MEEIGGGRFARDSVAMDSRIQNCSRTLISRNCRDALPRVTYSSGMVAIRTSLTIEDPAVLVPLPELVLAYPPIVHVS